MYSRVIALGLAASSFFGCAPARQVPNESLSFSGRDQYLLVEQAGEPSSEFTYEFWISLMADSQGLAQESFLVYPAYSIHGHVSFAITVSTEGIAVYEHSQGAFSQRISHSVAFSSHQWHHLALVVTKHSTRLLVDGQVADDQSRPAPTFLASFFLGAAMKGRPPFQGNIDELRVWSRALTTEELRTRMGEEVQGNEAGLSTYYDFRDVDAHAYIVDRSGNGHHGWVMTREPVFGIRPRGSAARLEPRRHVPPDAQR